MDIGKFKASRGRLIAWIMIPPVLVLAPALTSQALMAQSEWRLNRTKALAEVLPRLVNAKADAKRLVAEFQGREAGSLKSEDDLISYLQGAAGEASFLVDSLKVDRRPSAFDKNIPVLIASVKGSGTFAAIQDFVSDVSGDQHLLSESYMQISRPTVSERDNECRADITFELMLFSAGTAGGL